MIVSMQDRTRKTHFETLFNWNEESMMTFGLVNVLLLVDYDAIKEASNTMRAHDVERVGIVEKVPCVGIVDFVSARISCC